MENNHKEANEAVFGAILSRHAAVRKTFARLSRRNKAFLRKKLWLAMFGEAPYDAIGVAYFVHLADPTPKGGQTFVMLAPEQQSSLKDIFDAWVAEDDNLIWARIVRTCEVARSALQSQYYILELLRLMSPRSAFRMTPVQAAGLVHRMVEKAEESGRRDAAAIYRELLRFCRLSPIPRRVAAIMSQLALAEVYARAKTAVA